MTRAVFKPGAYEVDGIRFATLGDIPVRLQGAAPLALSVVHEYRIVPAASHRREWTGQVAGYRYEISHAGGPMILTFHWHPEGLSRVTMPHLHVGGPIQGVDLAKAHVPAGVITLAGVVAFLITDLGVRPFRDDWRTVLLAENH